jgi:hypothetical protein
MLQWKHNTANYVTRRAWNAPHIHIYKYHRDFDTENPCESLRTQFKLFLTVWLQLPTVGIATVPWGCHQI